MRKRNIEDKDVSKLTTKDFVVYVNKHPSYDFMKEIKAHLDRTLKRNYIFIDYFKETGFCFPFNSYVYQPIDKVEDLRFFLKFKNPKYKKMASRYFLNNLNTNILENFYDNTTPRTYVGSNFATNSFALNGSYYFVYGAYKTLIENPDVFSKEDVARFIDEYVKTLYKRTVHPKTDFKPYYVPSRQIKGAYQLIRPHTYYTAMKGMYYFDAKMLLEMAKFSKENNLPLTNIEQALKDLPLQVRTSAQQNRKFCTTFDGDQYYKTQYVSPDEEKECYDDCVREIENIITNKTISFDTKNKLSKKKKLSFKKPLKKVQEETIFEL